MDRSTKAKLEGIRKDIPRYRFRYWSDETADQPPSGGYVGLNTTTAITPLAFARGKGHKSVYDMPKEEFTQLAYWHLDTSHDIETEFSSWATSPGFVLQRLPGITDGGRDYVSRDGAYVSVIATEMLWETNQIFYVPLLGTKL
jgi:hypothetical protein